MHNDDVEIELPSPCLNGLDATLQRLGMLASMRTNQHNKEVLRRNNPCLNMVHINTRYVQNVSIGFRLRPSTPHVRYKPYTPKERHRTKSENTDEEINLIKAVVDDNMTRSQNDLIQLKKAKSLESIVGDSVDLKGIEIKDMEIVSNSIQNLKVGGD